MFRIILFTLCLFSFNLSKAQTTPVELILSSDSFNSYEYEVNPLKISNTLNVKISGFFASNDFVLIKPVSGYDIVLLPKNPLANLTNINSTFPDPPTTTVTTKPRGGGRPTTSVAIYPNPVQTDLTFTTTNKLVNEYKVYDAMGVLKISQTIAPTNTATINVINLTAGNYILKLNLDNGQQLNIQFIKN